MRKLPRARVSGAIRDSVGASVDRALSGRLHLAAGVGVGDWDAFKSVQTEMTDSVRLEQGQNNKSVELLQSGLRDAVTVVESEVRDAGNWCRGEQQIQLN